MAIKLFIGGTDRTDYLKVNSGRISGDINGRWTFNGQLEEQRRGYRPTRGQVLKISDGESPETKWFEGHIRRIVERAHPGTYSSGAMALHFDIDAGDYNFIAGRRTVTAEYENQTLYVIVNHINTNFLNGEGVAVTGVTNPGPTIAEKLTFRYESVASAFNRLSAITGYLWTIDFDKVLTFSEFTPNAAPISITDISENYRNFEVEVSDEDYRNRQHERTEIAVAASYGSASSSTPTEDPITAFAGQELFPTKGGVTEMRRITVDGVDKTFVHVPSDGQVPASGYDFYVLTDGMGFFALDWGPAVGGEILTCDYLGDYSFLSYGSGSGTNSGLTSADPAAGVRVITVDDADEQTARAAVEGGSGIWEAVEEQRNIASAETLKAIGEGRLRQYGSEAKRIRFETDEEGIEPGQRITINRPIHSINDTYLIERVDIDWVAAREDFLRTRITCSSEEPFGRAVGFVEKLVETARIGPGGGGGGTAASGGGVGASIVQEIPKGLVDGSNTVFYLTYIPQPPESLRLCVSGLRMNPHTDYTLSDATVTFNAGCQPQTGEEVEAWYFHGALRPVDAASSSARRFDGTGDYLNWGHDDAFQITGDLSIGMWVRLPSNAEGVLIMYGNAVSGIGNSGNELYSLSVAGSSGAWDIYYYHEATSGNFQNITFNTNILNDVWRYIGISRNTTAKTVSLYIGTPIGSLSLVATTAYTSNPTDGSSSTCTLTLGAASPPGTGLNEFIGDIHEHYLWNRALTQAEHESAMSGQPSSSGLILACELLGSSPEQDFSGNGHTGTVTGTTVIAGH